MPRFLWGRLGPAARLQETDVATGLTHLFIGRAPVLQRLIRIEGAIAREGRLLARRCRRAHSLGLRCGRWCARFLRAVARMLRGCMRGVHQDPKAPYRQVLLHVVPQARWQDARGGAPDDDANGSSEGRAGRSIRPVGDEAVLGGSEVWNGYAVGRGRRHAMNHRRGRRRTAAARGASAALELDEIDNGGRLLAIVRHPVARVGGGVSVKSRSVVSAMFAMLASGGHPLMHRSAGDHGRGGVPLQRQERHHGPDHKPANHPLDDLFPMPRFLEGTAASVQSLKPTPAGRSMATGPLEASFYTVQWRRV